jgi:integrase
MKYKPNRDLPEFAREAQTTSPSKLAEIVLNRRNEKVTPESVTMWFKRHPDVLDAINKELVQGLPTETQTVDTTIFQNGHFQEILTVKNWILEMNARELAKATIDGQVTTLRNICKGVFPQLKIDLIAGGKWCLKHPDRLTLNDAIELITLLKERGADPFQYKRALKDFLISKGVVIGKKIAVGRSRSYGKYAKLFVEMPKLQAMLNDLEAQNYEAFVADELMLETATRATATLNADIRNLQRIGDRAVITVFDKGRRSKYALGHPWDKRVSATLLRHIGKLIGDRKTGKIFNIDEHKLAELNRKVIMKYAPEVFERYPDLMVNHFWRHMFAQHMLRATDWNYAPVAALGGWTPQALEESYGKPPDETVKQWADKYSLTIEVKELVTA